jgi:hypothetical protein
MKNAFENVPRIAAAALLALLFMSGPATAASITLDGIFDGSPPYSSSDTVGWFNGHKTEDSIYGDQNSPLGTTTIHYGIGELAGDTSGTDYFFLYVDVPLYAKNMIWEGKDWKNDYPVTNTDPNAGLTEADVSSYRVHHETHHNPGDMKLDFKGATGSEKLVLNNSSGNEEFKANLAGDADNTFGLVGFKDSVDYLIDSGLATEALSLARDTKMSFEFQFELDSAQNNALLALFDNGIEFHLSPERGLNPVPVPSTMLLLCSGLIGLAGFRKKFKK